MALKTITDTIRDARGNLAVGFLLIRPTAAFKTSDGVTITGQQIRYPQDGSDFHNGAISLQLHNTSGAVPSGVSYEVRYILRGDVPRLERWQVGAAGPYTIPDVRVSTLTPTANIGLGQLAQGGATNGQALKWDSTDVSWEPGNLQDLAGILTVAKGGTGLASGTSGGIPAFTGSTTIASSAALTANGVILGGGAGVVPSATAAGTANQVLRIPGGGGAPTFGAVDLTQSSAVTGALPKANVDTAIARVTKYTISETALTDADTQQDITVYTRAAREVITGVRIKHSAAFTGGGLTAMTVQLGEGASPALYAPAFNIFQAPGDTILDDSDGFAALSHASGAVLARFDSTGANVSAATAGSVDIWIHSLVLP